MEVQFWTRHLGSILESWEVCSIKERTKTFEAADGEILTIALKEEEGIALRGIRDGRMCFSYTFEKGDKGAAALAENARTVMPYLDADPCNGLPGSWGSYPRLDLYDESGIRAGDDVKIGALLKMESTIRAADKRITRTRNCELHETELHVEIVNSNGLTAEARKTVYSLSATAVAEDGKEEVSWYDWSWSLKYGELNGRKLGTEIGKKAVSFLGGEVLETGVYQGILTPGCACQILEILAPSFLSENLYKNKTRLKDKTGATCFSDLLTIVDSGMRGAGAFPFDGEGVPSGENVLVSRGVFQGFLYDTCYGKRLDKASTGSAVRTGVKEPPRCGARGFFIRAGSAGNPEAGEGGIVVEELMGTHTANPVTGDFSVGAIGHRRVRHALVPFKGVILSGNLFDLLGRVKAVGEDLIFYGSHGSPTLLVDGLKISGK
ncbi:MAG: metallopeptidase TldD-related protein [Syntrophorhabdales bacterium]|jgi:PmbA protein